MNEINYGEVFSVETAGGENESAPAGQTAAAAETRGDSAGAKETAPAERSGTEKRGTQPGEAAADRREGDEEGGGPSRGAGKRNRAPDDDENARYAAARRKAERERDAAIAQARQAEQERDALLARSQRSAQDAAIARARQTAADDDARAFRAAARAAREQQQRMILDEQITAIGKLDPGVRTVADLLRREEYPQIYDYVRRCGLSVTDAFKLANYDSLTRSAAAGARQAALNAAGGKEHMTPTLTRGAGAAAVPQEVREMYRLYNPEATNSEIQEHYQRFHKA